jgi:hypothetical protein
MSPAQRPTQHMQTPPGPEPGNPQLPDYTKAYFRPSDLPYGTPEKLQALADGYFGLSWAFVANIVLAIAARALLEAFAQGSNFIVALAMALPGMFCAVFLVTLPLNRKIALGMGWQPSSGFLASFLMGLNSALCCGVVGYIVMQMIAAAEMKRYGLRSGFLGIRKAHVRQKLEEMRGKLAHPRP